MGLAEAGNITVRMPGHIYQSQWSKQVAILKLVEINKLTSFQILLCSVLPSYESRGLHLITDFAFLMPKCLWQILLLCFRIEFFPFSPVWFVQGHLISQLFGSFLSATKMRCTDTEKAFLRSPDDLQGWYVYHLFSLHADFFLVSASSLFCSYSPVFILYLSYKCHNNDESIIWYSLATFNLWLRCLWAIPPNQGSSADNCCRLPHTLPPSWFCLRSAFGIWCQVVVDRETNQNGSWYLNPIAWSLLLVPQETRSKWPNKQVLLCPRSLGPSHWCWGDGHFCTSCWGTAINNYRL